MVSAIVDLDPGLVAAAGAFFPDAAGIAAIPFHPNLARVETPTGAMRVHRWPAQTPESDAAFSHAAIAAMHQAGLTTVPVIAALPGTAETIFRHNGWLYDAQNWLPGAPPARAEIEWPDAGQRIELPVTLPASIFGEIIAVIAQLHDATAGLIDTPGAPAAPLGMLPGAVEQAQRRHLLTLRPRATREPAIQRWLAVGERLLATAGPAVLRAAADTAPSSTAVHLGLWPSHLLIDGGQLSGVLGWERAAVGTPLLDLAQAVLRLHGWTDDIVETAIGVYSDLRPLSPIERRLLPAVAALDAVATTGRLLEQTFAGGRADRPPTPIRAAIDSMLRSMSILDRTLSAPDKPRRRIWRRTAAPHPPALKGARTDERPRRRHER